MELFVLMSALAVVLGFALVARQNNKRPAAEGEAACRWCGGRLEIRERWPAGKVIGFWVGMLFCLVGLLALFMRNDRQVVCRSCGAPQ
jgi:DNA-directed RNA polymerase subunit RPC12/RpoP